MNGALRGPGARGACFEEAYRTMRQWDRERMMRAERRHGEMYGELPRNARAIGVVAIDGSERPENIRLPGLYAPYAGEVGLLCYVNFEEDTPAEWLSGLLGSLKEQRDSGAAPNAAIVAARYPKGRRIDQLRTDAWDVGAVHVHNNDLTSQVIGISNDADIMSLSLDYLTYMTLGEGADRSARAWGTSIKYDDLGMPDSHIMKLLRYLNAGRDLFRTIARAPIPYGASMAMSFETYMRSLRGWCGAPGSESARYGQDEEQMLLTNIYTNSGAVSPASNALSRRVGLFQAIEGSATVSPRRELWTLMRNMGAFEAVNIDAFTTDPKSELRRLRHADLQERVRIADGSIDMGGYRAQLDDLDRVWLGTMAWASERVAENLRGFRQSIGLPRGSLL